MGELAATIVELWRYPVKSMQGERLQSVALDASGLAADRRYGVVTPDGFVLSAKSEPRILGASASVRDDGEIAIDLPNGMRTASDDPDVDAQLSAWLDRPLRLHRAGADEQFTIHHHTDPEDETKTKDFSTPPGAYYDSRSTVHLLSQSSLRAAAAAYAEGQWDVRRFRPNLVVSFGDEEDGFVEEQWVGATVTLGAVPAVVRKRTERCVLTTRAQPGLERDLQVYRSLVKSNHANLGIYLVPQAAGTLAVGDTVKVSAQ
ncbi:MAG: MOSC N-terminal beta barrel domain-containing protein [Acidimicrobiales bacterium]